MPSSEYYSEQAAPTQEVKGSSPGRRSGDDARGQHPVRSLTGRHGKAAQLAANEAMRDLMRNTLSKPVRH